MRDCLLSGHLPHLVEEDVQLVLGEQVLQTPVAEALDWSVCYEGAHQVQVPDVPGQVRVVEGQGGVVVQTFLVLVDLRWQGRKRVLQAREATCTGWKRITNE